MTSARADEGFTLIEILVAVALVSAMYGIFNQVSVQ